MNGNSEMNEFDLEKTTKEAIAYYRSPERKAYSSQRISNSAGDIVASVERTLAQDNSARDAEIVGWLDEFEQNA